MEMQTSLDFLETKFKDSSEDIILITRSECRELSETYHGGDVSSQDLVRELLPHRSARCSFVKDRLLRGQMQQNLVYLCTRWCWRVLVSDIGDSNAEETFSTSFVAFQYTNVDLNTRRNQLRLGKHMLGLYRGAIDLRFAIAKLEATSLRTRAAASSRLETFDFDGPKLLMVVLSIEKKIEAIMAGRVISTKSFNRITEQHSIDDREFLGNFEHIARLMRRCHWWTEQALFTLRIEQKDQNKYMQQKDSVRSPDSTYIDEQFQKLSQNSQSLHHFVTMLDNFKSSDGTVSSLTGALSFYTNSAPISRKGSHNTMLGEDDIATEKPVSVLGRYAAERHWTPSGTQLFN